jgi:D-alanyl-D-alanine carboxypeptidase
MRARGRIGFGAALAMLLGCGAASAQMAENAAALLEATRQEIGVPGMALAVWRDGRIVAEAAAGERALGSGVPVEPADPFHIGSITKPFTATLAARLVERGLLTWDDTVGERLGPVIAVGEAYRSVNLAQLLAHRGGLRPDGRPAETARLAQIRGLPERRLAAAELMLAARPVGEPGSSYLYSNYSYVVAAAMIEEATGRAYEALLEEEVLAPLRLASAGFGAPGSGRRIDAPWGHAPSGWEVIGPIPPDNGIADNAAFLHPAGGLHISMRELALFGADQLRGAGGEPGTLLRPQSYRFLHRQLPTGWATGWALGPGGELFHDGTNLRWFALIRVLPAESLVVAIAANSVGDEDRTRRGVWALSERLRALP